MKAFGLFLLAPILAAPTFVKRANETEDVGYLWSNFWQKDFEIHKSCNDTQVNQLQQAFSEVLILAQHAKDHTLRFGILSDFFVKYFGNATTGEVIGLYDEVISGNKTGILFRCDNIDGNCKNAGWAGHWRGDNATDETVICDLSYTSRQYLAQVCSRGYTVAGSPNNVYWASDLLHRIWHTAKLGHDIVGHYADTYSECLELAEHNSSLATRNSATLRFYALDVYAYDIAVPGKGCTGEPAEKEDSHDHAATSTASTTSADSSTTTSTAVANCHTHSDGQVHCE